LAAVWLYESRGVQDYDPTTGQAVHRLRWNRDDAKTKIKEILAGVIRLSAAKVGLGTNAPIIVK
jgi:hypothetical protein